MQIDSELLKVSADPSRLAALDALDLLDTPPEEEFDRICELITLIFGVEIGIVSLMDAHRQWYKAVVGLPSKEADLRETFCKYPLVSGQLLVVEDASKDGRFSDHPSVVDGPQIRFYAGMPLITADGQVVGSICAIDKRAREFGARERTILSHLASTVVKQFELRVMAGTDVLTGVMSRRAFKQDCAKHLALAKRHATPVSCVVFDIDHFKHVNDTYGHASGDRVLVEVAAVARAVLRETDLLGRIGGEEFAVLLPHAETPEAITVAEKLRQLIHQQKFPGSVPTITISASFGVASLVPGEDIDVLIHKADQALYEAKKTGRNRVCRWRATDDQQRVNRRRVLKSGQIVFDNHSSVMDCTVRSIWDGGAELQLSMPITAPDQFALRIRGARTEERCSVIYRGERSMEVAFV